MRKQSGTLTAMFLITVLILIISVSFQPHNSTLAYITDLSSNCVNTFEHSEISQLSEISQPSEIPQPSKTSQPTEISHRSEPTAPSAMPAEESLQSVPDTPTTGEQSAVIWFAGMAILSSLITAITIRKSENRR